MTEDKGVQAHFKVNIDNLIKQDIMAMSFYVILKDRLPMITTTTPPHDTAVYVMGFYHVKHCKLELSDPFTVVSYTPTSSKYIVFKLKAKKKIAYVTNLILTQKP